MHRHEAVLTLFRNDVSVGALTEVVNAAVTYRKFCCTIADHVAVVSICLHTNEIVCVGVESRYSPLVAGRIHALYAVAFDVCRDVGHRTVIWNQCHFTVSASGRQSSHTQCLCDFLCAFLCNRGSHNGNGNATFHCALLESNTIYIFQHIGFLSTVLLMNDHTIDFLLRMYSHCHCSEEHS